MLQSKLFQKFRMIWNSIPSQLAKENKKFIYGLIREGSRAKDFETAIMWLCDCGSCEIDFILDTGRRIVPMEIKAEIILNAKNLKTYREKFNPEICIHTLMADCKKEDWLLNLPLYK